MGLGPGAFAEWDADGDGVADLLEDLDGDGTVDSGEASWSDTDNDDDGMPNAWELAHGLDPGSSEADADPDGDGVSNSDEFLNGTDPFDRWATAWSMSEDRGQVQAPLNSVGVVAMDGGLFHSVALTTGGQVRAWGQNNQEQSTVPTNFPRALAVAAAWNQSCAISREGRLVYISKTNGSPPVLTDAVALALGWQHGIVLRRGGTVEAWGTTNSAASTNLPGLTGVKAIAAGWQHNVALRSDGTIACWGANYADLGWNLTDTNSATGAVGDIVAIAAGGYHTLALKANGAVVAWGAGKAGGSHWADKGQCIVPAAATNVVAIAAGGYSSMALRSDGSMVLWGEATNSMPCATNAVALMTNVVAIGAGDGHCFASRAGAQTPFIRKHPASNCVGPGNPAEFHVVAFGPNLQYQWQIKPLGGSFADVSGATNKNLVLANVQAGNLGIYRVKVWNGAGELTSDEAGLNDADPPTLVSKTEPSSFKKLHGEPLTLTLTADTDCRTAFLYYFSLNGNTLMPMLHNSQTMASLSNAHSGVYTIIATNTAGTVSNTWTLDVAGEGHLVYWGNGTNDWNHLTVTNTIAIAAGMNHGVLAREDGTVYAWGSNSQGQTNVPTSLSNVWAVAAGDAHTLVLRENGTVAAWGKASAAQTNIAHNLSNVAAVSAGGDQSLALLNDGTVVQWGQTYASVPAGLSGVKAIASGSNFHVALKHDGTLVAWGNNAYNQTNPPSGTNYVAVAAGGTHALALRADGVVAPWGSTVAGDSGVASSLTGVMGIAAGASHSMALRNDGTVVTWGANLSYQTNTPLALQRVKLIAAGGSQSFASIHSPYLNYPVNPETDMLLIFNTNSVSTNSLFVKDYYKLHRPNVSRANELGILTSTNETVNLGHFQTNIWKGVTNWLAENPTKRPGYIILFYGIPSRVNEYTNTGDYFGGGDVRDSTNYAPSVSVQLRSAMAIEPVVTHINLHSTNDCVRYIEKLASFGATYSPGRVLISPHRSNYASRTFVIDNIRHGSGWDLQPYGNYDSDRFESVYQSARDALVAQGKGLDIWYASDLETQTGGVQSNRTHLTGATNVLGYVSWGFHSSLGNSFSIDGKVTWGGSSGWWIMATYESFNGQRYNPTQARFLDWFSATAFGGNNFSNTPVGTVTHVDEPGDIGVSPGTYLSLWAEGKSFGACAWVARLTPYYQPVGDPLTAK